MRNTLLAPFVLAAASHAFAQNNVCERACLENTVDRFLDAFIKHDPKAAGLSSTSKYTENGQRLEMGDGSWPTRVGKGTYRLYVVDVPAGQIAFIGALREEDRQKAEGQAVLVVRNERAATNSEKLGMPNHLFLEDVPAWAVTGIR